VLSFLLIATFVSLIVLSSLVIAPFVLVTARAFVFDVRLLFPLFAFVSGLNFRFFCFAFLSFVSHSDYRSCHSYHSLHVGRTFCILFVFFAVVFTVLALH
jgi:hypothetical protein